MALPSSIDVATLKIEDFLHWYKAIFAGDNYDGDTAKFEIDLGYHLADRLRTYRLLGINAPEVNKTETRAAGLKARDYLKFLLEGKPLIIDSIKDKADKYGGRWLGEIWALQGDGTWLNVNQEMINAGHAVPYNP